MLEKIFLNTSIFNSKHENNYDKKCATRIGLSLFAQYEGIAMS